MVTLLQCWQVGQVRGVGWVNCRWRSAASFNQGDTWKKLIKRYIHAMPLIGSMPEAEAQMALRGASVIAIHAIRAKVGDPARAIQPAASRTRQVPALRRFAAISVVIFSLPSDFGRLWPFKTQASH
jgi:hypothetical protein